MNETLDGLSGVSRALIVIAFMVILLGGRVAFGYLRQAGRDPRRIMLPLFAGAATLALGLATWSAVVLGASSAPVGFEIGFDLTEAPQSLVIALLTAALPVAVLARQVTALRVVAAGMLLGGGSLLTQVGVAVAAGFQPENHWPVRPLVIAGFVMGIGAVAALWVSFLAGGRTGQRRRTWRWVACGLMAMSLLAGQELVLKAGATDEDQVHAQHDGEIPATPVALSAALGTPMLLLIGAIDLRLRRSVRQEGKRPQPPRRQRRRMRIPRI